MLGLKWLDHLASMRRRCPNHVSISPVAKGFRNRMYKARLSSWELGKNITKQDWIWVAISMQQRKEAGKIRTAIEMRDKPRTMKEYRKAMVKYEITEANLSAEANALGSDAVPYHVRCFTPETTGSTSEDPSATGPPPVSSNKSKQRAVPIHQSSSSHSSANGPHSGKMSSFVKVRSKDIVMQLPSQPNGERAPTEISTDDFEVQSSKNAPSSAQHGACDRLQQDVRTMIEQTTSPERLQSFAPGLGDLPAWHLLSRCPGSGFLEEICSRCGKEISKHDPIPPDFLSEPATEITPKYQSLDLGVETRDYSAFTAANMSACMYGVRGEFDVLSMCLLRASSIYKQMLLNDDPLALVGINTTLIWMHAHEQGPMAGSVIRSALRVALDVLSEENDITLTLEWMTAVAFKKQKECRIKTPMLRNVHQRFQISHGPRHRHTIVALYNLGYSLIQDKAYEDAEMHLHALVDISTHTLGASSLQTVSALNALSRAQAWQGNYEIAMTTLERGLRHAPLGANHPYRLESVRRLAYLLKKQGRVADEEPLRWTVLRGRIATLGRHHPSTQKAHEDLVDLLKEVGTWEAKKGEVEQAFEVTDTVSQHITEDEDRWRRIVVEGSRC